MNEYGIITIGFILVLNFYYFAIGRRVREKQKLISSLIITVLFSILIAMKPDTLKDAVEYSKAFFNADYWIGRISKVNFFQKYYNFEYGFLYLNHLFRKLSTNIHIFYFCIAFFNIWITPKYLSKLVSQENREDLFRIILINWYGILYSGIAIRAGLVIALGVMAVYYATKNRYIKVAALLIIAFLIQRSSIIFVFLIGLSIVFRMVPEEKLKRICFSVSGVLLILSPLGIGEYTSAFMDKALVNILNLLKLQNYYLSYANNDSSDGGLGIAKTLVLLMCVVIFWILLQDETHYPSLIYVSVLFAVIVLVFFSGMRAASRMYDMGLFFLIPMCAQIGIEYGNSSRFKYISGFCFANLVMILVQINTCFIH